MNVEIGSRNSFPGNTYIDGNFVALYLTLGVQSMYQLMEASVYFYISSLFHNIYMIKIFRSSFQTYCAPQKCLKYWTFTCFQVESKQEVQDTRRAPVHTITGTQLPQVLYFLQVSEA
jgi:hypothetical protein